MIRGESTDREDRNSIGIAITLAGLGITTIGATIITGSAMVTGFGIGTAIVGIGYLSRDDNNAR